MTSAREFASRLIDLLRCEQGAMADFLVALAAFDKHRMWVGLGHTSLFYFLHRELKLSAGAAYHRKTAAELLQRFPEVIEPLRDGRLCLSSVCELAKVVTPENLAEVLPRFFHASKQQAKAVAVEIAPLEVVPQRMVVTAVAPQEAIRVRSSPSQLAAPESHAAPPALELGQALHPGETQSPTPRESAVRAVAALPASASRTTTEPLTADLRRLHVTVSKRFMEKMEAARDALSHSHPGADAEAILEAGLDLVIERAAKRKGLVKRPRAAPAARSQDAAGETGGNHRYVPAAAKREVWTRDSGRCQWSMADGGICGSTHRAELDHVVPVARGGLPTVDGLRVLCRFHNDLAAREAFGDGLMDGFTTGAGGKPQLTASGPPPQVTVA